MASRTFAEAVSALGWDLSFSISDLVIGISAIATVLIAIATLRLQRRQSSIEKENLRCNQFQLKYEIYRSLHDMMFEVCYHRLLPTEKIEAFLRNRPAIQFIFGKEIDDYIARLFVRFAEFKAISESIHQNSLACAKILAKMQNAYMSEKFSKAEFKKLSSEEVGKKKQQLNELINYFKNEEDSLQNKFNKYRAFCDEDKY